MGILDDAIREHLDLKRRLGTEEEELTRLEGEAFGPPSRPGDPDFPEQPPTGESPGLETAEATPEADEAGPVTAEEEVPQPPHAVEPEPDPVAPEAIVAEPPPEPEPELPADEELPDAAVPLARELRAIVEPGADPATGESAEVRPEDELDLDLDLELDEPEPEPQASDPLPTPTREQPPVESFDTVEHHFEDAIEDTGDIEVVDGEIADEPLTGEDEQVREPNKDEDDEDVLEETPEFLRDQPEDDELWFEQGSPKDFDF